MRGSGDGRLNDEHSNGNFERTVSICEDFERAVSICGDQELLRAAVAENPLDLEAGFHGASFGLSRDPAALELEELYSLITSLRGGSRTTLITGLGNAVR